VTGRVGKKIHGLSNKYPSLTLYYIFKNLYFDHNIKLNYQAHQNQVGKLDIWIKEELKELERNILLTECRKYFKEDVSIKILHRLNFRESQGKLRDFISSIE
jgi:phenylacetate-CoA ligase